MVLVYPPAAEAEQVHPVGLGDRLGQQRDIPAGKDVGRGQALDPLPLGEVVVALAADQREEGEGEHVVDHVRVAAEHLHQVLDEADLPGNLGEQPHRSVQQAAVLPGVRRPSRLVLALQLLEPAQVPALGEDESIPAVPGIDEPLVRDEDGPVLHRAPVDDAVGTPAVVVICLVRRGIGALPVPPDMQVYLVVVSSGSRHLPPLY
ncbi:hypothetical protein SDC9_59204 [bioreactor metagenome]|uniref:Uncharacterized protein n=1 Tax=bioreactor metagenome TaxID=1076179 RepID=A0A644X9K3_9ZZZZ